MKDVSEQTKAGIRTHSWSPWLPAPKRKFGTPACYEAQVAATADQIAGINHDTEDILMCDESEHNLEKIRENLPDYLSEKNYLDYNSARTILDTRFLPMGAEEANGFARKIRLREILDDIFQATKDSFEKHNLDSAKQAPEHTLCISQDMGAFLAGYEDYVRNQIIHQVWWFRNRDEVAASVVRHVVHFLTEYGFAGNGVRTGGGKVQALLARFSRSVRGDDYSTDSHFNELRAQSIPGVEKDLEHLVKVLDYVTGMTDIHIMEIYHVLGL